MVAVQIDPEVGAALVKALTSWKQARRKTTQHVHHHIQRPELDLNELPVKKEKRRMRRTDNKSTTRSCISELSQHTEEVMVCTICKKSMRVDDYQYRCIDCGYTCKRNNMSVASMAYNEKISVPTGNYKRYLHFKSLIRKRVPTKATNASNFSKDEIESVCEALSNIDGVANSCYVSMYNVKKACRDVGITGNNKVIAYTELLSGKSHPYFTTFDMGILYCMFQAMQAPFQENKSAERINFLHYNQCAFRLLLLCGYDNYLYTWFYPMVGKNKIDEFDELFQPICESLRWQFAPTLRHEEAMWHQSLRDKQQAIQNTNEDV